MEPMRRPRPWTNYDGLPCSYRQSKPRKPLARVHPTPLAPEDDTEAERLTLVYTSWA
jgi:hypothetical protein